MRRDIALCSLIVVFVWNISDCDHKSGWAYTGSANSAKVLIHNLIDRRDRNGNFYTQQERKRVRQEAMRVDHMDVLCKGGKAKVTAGKVALCGVSAFRRKSSCRNTQNRGLACTSAPTRHDVFPTQNLICKLSSAPNGTHIHAYTPACVAPATTTTTEKTRQRILDPAATPLFHKHCSFSVVWLKTLAERRHSSATEEIVNDRNHSQSRRTPPPPSGRHNFPARRCPPFLHRCLCLSRRSGHLFFHRPSHDGRFQHRPHSRGEFQDMSRREGNRRRTRRSPRRGHKMAFRRSLLCVIRVRLIVAAYIDMYLVCVF